MLAKHDNYIISTTPIRFERMQYLFKLDDILMSLSVDQAKVSNGWHKFGNTQNSNIDYAISIKRFNHH